MFALIFGYTRIPFVHPIPGTSNNILEDLRLIRGDFLIQSFRRLFLETELNYVHLAYMITILRKLNMVVRVFLSRRSQVKPVVKFCSNRGAGPLDYHNGTKKTTD